MAKLKESFVFAGMQRDLSVSKHPTQFLYDAKNIRITARDGDTMLSITNERGPKRINRKDSEEYLTITGEYIAHCLLNQYLVVLVYGESSTGSTSMVNKMFRIDLKNLTPKMLFEYDFGTTPEDHVDMIASYENEGVQKIYWTDGKSQPKVINIADPRIEERSQHSERWYPFTSEYMFDFVPALSLNETVGVKKILGSGGEFAPGVIQYAFTYYYKYGQESNIFYTTPLLYISYGDRGASPEDKVDNVFEITVKHLDTKFDYLRIYSIQRTSINATPFCKRVQDIALEGITDDKITFTDTGTIGDNVDPTELLYKGGETITAKTLEQKDNTLFLGNLSITRNPISKVLDLNRDSEESDINLIRNTIAPVSDIRRFKPFNVFSGDYKYTNQLTSYDVYDAERSVPCSGYKKGDTYRLGVQFQHNSGKWSEPIYLDNKALEVPGVTDENKYRFADYITQINVPGFRASIQASIGTKLMNAGYLKARAVVVFPTMQDRKTICQAVVCPTLYTNNQRYESKSGSLYAQSSWFFRTIIQGTSSTTRNVAVNPANGTVAPYFGTNAEVLPYADAKTEWDTTWNNDRLDLRQIEIQGHYSSDNKFRIDSNTLTLHSPDVQFDDQLAIMDYNAGSLRVHQIGFADIRHTLSDIEVQTETPTISNSGAGCAPKSFTQANSKGIVGGLFYDDFLVDDSGEIEKFSHEYHPVKWLMYPWQGNGSINNDMNRPADKGIESTILKKKVISNLRYATTIFKSEGSSSITSFNPVYYGSDEATIVRLTGSGGSSTSTYMGNVDTMLNPDESDGQYFAVDYSYSIWNGDGWDTVIGRDHEGNQGSTSFTSNLWYKTFSLDPDNPNKNGIYTKTSLENRFLWSIWGQELGDDFIDLVMFKKPVRMKYKTTPHLIVYVGSGLSWWDSTLSSLNAPLPLVELRRNDLDPNTLFGGESMDALKANVWIPAGEPVVLSNTKDTTVKWEYGDTYYQRYDCLKTYAFTPEDPNQVVEIGSFMLETHVNIDGRYDRNRGQINNLNMSPQNFNLINPVYSQTDNFFSYRILDDDYYKNNEFPNQFTWTKEKQSGADVDLWTNITLASTYDIDGSKGAIKSLNFWKDTIYCFQDKGISRILFNSRVQIPASDGVPIEISNNYKVDGYQYLSDGIGCKNIHLIKETPSGIYFIDSVAGHLFQLGEGLSDITEKCNMTTWFKKKGPSVTRVLYDDIHHDVYLPYNDGDGNVDWTLCFSEKVGQFTGFYSYGVYPMMESYNHRIFTLYPYSYETPKHGTFHSQELHTLFEGDYNTFFEYGNSKTIVYKPSEFTFICNGSSNNVVGADKIFTNLEFRASVEGDGELNEETGKFTPTLPLNTIEVWDEYQHGIATLENKSGHSFFEHFIDDGIASLKRKFRIWRCDIPRDNVPINPTTEAPMGIYRKGAVGSRPHRNDRMRNPWLFIKLVKDAPEEGNPRVELHDLQVTYFA